MSKPQKILISVLIGLVLMMIGIGVKAAVVGPGGDCSTGSGNTCVENVGLKCKDTNGDETPDTCLPENPGNQQIGQACLESSDCGKDPATGTDLTCQEIPEIGYSVCIGNADGVIGCEKTLKNLSDEDVDVKLCSAGLECKGNICKQTFGAGKVENVGVGKTARDIRDQIMTIINILLGFLAILGVIMVIYGGVMWATAAGDEEKVGKAKKTIISAVIGLVIIGLAWTIISYVLNLVQRIGGG